MRARYRSLLSLQGKNTVIIFIPLGRDKIMKKSDGDFRKANQVTIITFKEISMTSPSKHSAGLD